MRSHRLLGSAALLLMLLMTPAVTRAQTLDEGPAIAQRLDEAPSARTVASDPEERVLR